MQLRQSSPTIVVRHPPELPRQLVSNYLKDCQTQVPTLCSAVNAGDYEHARLFGHKLKGTGTPYGFQPLTEFGAAIERAAFEHNTLALQTHVNHLSQYLGNVELAVD